MVPEDKSFIGESFYKCLAIAHDIHTPDDVRVDEKHWVMFVAIAFYLSKEQA